MSFLSLSVILILTFAFGYLIGLNGAGSVIATIVSSRSMNPRAAVALAIFCMVVGPFVLGLAVVSTISADLVSMTAVNAPVIIAALAGAVLWVSLAAHYKIPSSTTHAFIGSLVGAVTAGFGIQAIVAGGLAKALLALIISPLLGVLVGYVIVKLSYRAAATATPSVNQIFKAGQVALSMLVGLSFGSNDGQKIMGIVALGVMATSKGDFAVPYWAAAFAAVALAAGTLIGSRRVVETLGGRLYKIQPIHGFGAQTASGIVLLSASLLGSPVSGSQVIASAIVGAGSAERVRMVRWGVFRSILSTWVLTIPSAAFIGALLYLILSHLSL